MVGGEGRGLDVGASIGVFEVGCSTGDTVIGSGSDCWFVQGKMPVGGANTVLSSEEALFVRDAVLGWGSQRKLKSDWGMVSGAGTLGRRAANLLPASDYVS